MVSGLIIVVVFLIVIAASTIATTNSLVVNLSIDSNQNIQEAQFLIEKIPPLPFYYNKANTIDNILGNTEVVVKITSNVSGRQEIFNKTYQLSSGNFVIKPYYEIKGGEFVTVTVTKTGSSRGYQIPKVV